VHLVPLPIPRRSLFFFPNLALCRSAVETGCACQPEENPQDQVSSYSFLLTNPSTPRPGGLGPLRVGPERRFFAPALKDRAGAAQWVNKIPSDLPRAGLPRKNLTRISGMIFGKLKRSLPSEKRTGGLTDPSKNNTRDGHFQPIRVTAPSFLVCPTG